MIAAARIRILNLVTAKKVTAGQIQLKAMFEQAAVLKEVPYFAVFRLFKGVSDQIIAAGKQEGESHRKLPRKQKPCCKPNYSGMQYCIL